jgi:GNAT superfamily N-acetyltransferase
VAIRTLPGGISLRPMAAADVKPAAVEVERGDFGDRRAFFDFAVRHPACDPIVALANGAIVGTGIGTRNGEAGWVGVIYVVPERRGQGLGRALSEVVCDRLEDRGCRTLVLVATSAGRPVYERLGFHVTTRYHIMEATGLPGGQSPDDGVRQFHAVMDLDDAIRLDRRATGEDRTSLIQAFASANGCLALRDARGRLQGFLIKPTWHGAAIIASNSKTALRILDHRRRQAGPDRRVRAGLLEQNLAGRKAFEARGWTESWTGTRMERGRTLELAPEMIYGQFNFASG